MIPSIRNKERCQLETHRGSYDLVIISTDQIHFTHVVWFQITVFLFNYLIAINSQSELQCLQFPTGGTGVYTPECPVVLRISISSTRKGKIKNYHHIKPVQDKKQTNQNCKDDLFEGNVHCTKCTALYFSIIT